MVKPDKIFCGMLETNYNVLTMNIELIVKLPLVALNALKSYIKMVENAIFKNFWEIIADAEYLTDQFLDILETKWNDATEDMCYAAWRCYVVRDLCGKKSIFQQNPPELEDRFDGNFDLFQTQVCGGAILDLIHETVDKGLGDAKKMLSDIQGEVDGAIDEKMNDLQDAYDHLLEDTYISFDPLTAGLYMATAEYEQLETDLVVKRNNTKSNSITAQEYYFENVYTVSADAWNENISDNIGVSGDNITTITETGGLDEQIVTKQDEITTLSGAVTTLELTEPTTPEGISAKTINLAISGGALELLQNDLVILSGVDRETLIQENVDLGIQNSYFSSKIDTMEMYLPTNETITATYNEQKIADDKILNPLTPPEGAMNYAMLMEELDKYAQCAIGACDFAYTAMNFKENMNDKMSLADNQSGRGVDSTSLTESMDAMWASMSMKMSSITKKIDSAYEPKTVKIDEVMKNFESKIN